MDYVVLYNDGNLEARDFKNECGKEGWIPVLVLRDKNDKVTVPMFKDPEIAYKFMRRNISKNIVSGLVNLFDEDIKEMEEKGWNIEFMNFPRKFTSSNYKIDFEIIKPKGELGINYYRSIRNYR